MVCVYCGGETKVVNSRPQRRNNQVWRRRRCSTCGAQFTTQEAAQLELAWQVGHEGHIQPFSRDKLLLSLFRSCEHRKAALSDAEALTETVIKKLHVYVRNGLLDSKDVARVAQVALNRFDKTASMHYAAYHRSA